MGVGLVRARNWGKDDQAVALALALEQKGVAFMVTNTKRDRCLRLWLAASRGGLTLPFTECFAEFFNVRRGRWESRHVFDDRLLATGVSKRDVIRASIQAVWD